MVFKQDTIVKAVDHYQDILVDRKLHHCDPKQLLHIFRWCVAPSGRPINEFPFFYNLNRVKLLTGWKKPSRMSVRDAVRLRIRQPRSVALAQFSPNLTRPSHSFLYYRVNVSDSGNDAERLYTRSPSSSWSRWPLAILQSISQRIYHLETIF